MKNAGFLNLPSWKENLQEILIKISREDILKLPLLGRENSDNIWSAFDKEEFFSLVETGIYFLGRPVSDFPKKVITSNASFAVERLKSNHFRDTYFSAAIGGIFPFIKILSDCSISKPVKFFVQNDAFSNLVLSIMEKEGKNFEEAVCDARWKEETDDNSNFSLHGIRCLNRLVLQIAEIFGCFVDSDKVICRGISKLDKVDIDISKELGMSIRLIGIAEYNKNILKVISEPCIMPSHYFIAQTKGGSEIIYLKTEDGQTHVYACPGSSKESIVRGIVNDLNLVSCFDKQDLKNITNIEDFENKFYLRFNLINLTNTLSELLNVFARNGIEVEKLYQPKVSCETIDGEQIIIITNNITRKKLNSALDVIFKDLKLASLKADFRIIDRG
jgi:homoserine dehydrogenase